MTNDDRQFIETEVQSGHFATPSEAIAALRSQRERGGQFEEFRAKIHFGLEQLSRGEGILWDAETVKMKGRSFLDSQRHPSQ